MKIGIASDHAGYKLKSIILQEFSKSKKYQFIDYGTNDSEASVDYPDFAQKLSKELVAKKVEFGILICGSGVGISIAANRFKEIRAALCHNQKVAKLSRQHNDANILCLGARIISKDAAIKSVKAFLSTKFEGGRHSNRIQKMS